MKAAVYGYRADVIGLFWLALALFLSLALSSYNPMDPSFNSLSTLDQVQNKCGYLGSFLSDLLYQFFGLGAWGLVIFALKQSLTAFQRKWVTTGKIKDIAIVALSLFVCSSLLELHQPGRSFFQGHIYSGGLLGQAVINISQPYLHFAGNLLLFWSLALVLFVLITKSSVSDFFIKTLFLLRKKGKKLFLISALRTQKILIKLKDFCASFLSKGFLFSKKRGGKKQISIFPLPRKQETTEQTSFFTPVSEEKNYFFKEDEEGIKKEEVHLSDFSTNDSEVKWTLPSVDLLSAPVATSLQLSAQESKEDAVRLKRKLEQFSISGEITNIRSGPVITLFEFKPEDHIKVARITQMEDDLMIALKSKSIRIIAPIPGRDVVGIETAHTKRQTVYLKHLVDEPAFWQSSPCLPLVLGRHVDGRFAIQDLRKIPHLMVAGSTGSGKSVFVVSFLLSLLFRHTPESLRLVLVDPKRVDLSVFEGLPHLLAPPIRESHEAFLALNWCLGEMQKRYRSLARFRVRDLSGFNTKTKNLDRAQKKEHKEFVNSLKNTSQPEDYYFSPQPYICIVLEEFGDLMSSSDRSRIENVVVRLAQMARACGMHLILSMQSPRKDVITGLIKTNIPGRISFKVSSRIDSRIILDEGGAERLLSQGDMLYLGPGQARPDRYHGPFVQEKEVLSVVQFWKKQIVKNSYPLDFSVGDKTVKHLEKENLMDQEDKKYAEVFTYVSELKEVSASHLQRKYSLGYPRAARFIDRLEEEGIIGPAKGSKPREVLIHK